MCSYCLARFVPFFTPRGGIGLLSLFYACRLDARRPPSANVRRVSTSGAGGYQQGATSPRRGRRRHMYIGGGVLALILIILLLIWLF